MMGHILTMKYSNSIGATETYLLTFRCIHIIYVTEPLYGKQRVIERSFFIET